MMTVEELAKYLKLKPDTIYKKVRKGELPAIKLGKLLRFPRELVDQWVSDQASRTAKAKEVITHKVGKVVGQVNRRAKVASKVFGDVPDLLENVKNAPLAQKQATLSKGLRELWQDLNREMTHLRRGETGTKTRKSAAKTRTRAKAKPSRSGRKTSSRA